MRRSIPTTAAALGLTLALAACSSGSGEEAEATTEGAATAEGTLTMWVDDTRITEMEPVVAAFTAKTGVEVELVQKASGDIGKDFVAQAPTGEGPDVIVSAHDGLGEWVNNGVVAPLELGDQAAAFSPAAIAGVTYDGATYGTPISIENIALVRNDALDPDTTATTFDELVAEAKEAGTDFSVLIQQGDASDPYHLYPLQTSFGAPVFESTADGSYTDTLALGGEAGDAFAAYLAKLGQEQVLDLAIDGDKAKQAFLDGQAPYIITGPWNTSAFLEAGMEISVLPVPSAGGEPAQPFVGVQGVFVSAKSANPVLANELVVNFLATEEAQDMLYTEGGRMPALTASAEKVDDPILQGFNEAGATGAPMPAIPAMSSVWASWGATQAQIVGGQAGDPASAWEAMVGTIQDAIDQA
ncbi:sugar ABC transporter substrate-binding protein [Cellulomonas oligotrophica]|uniref:Arabinogalactan oligomer/maltooligosaccharide transport system substrate-binding protein n=1 Tax=Cellulomonas oligotrophica TaxID=931536 RepID=A0A7Y9FD31_9CELL|nr:extracellular solute-binding protein [Cellulomonas oligotrophica]NYD85060.1 arabinogalactan oligomer/maltooligosaccharide transport system substrate-binding protein [Cellulomonas oligotrophica]GIG33765.1 sugar ABC transporter substrate-binding protein [Cellulomonas oligotrophica]